MVEKRRQGLLNLRRREGADETEWRDRDEATKNAAKPNHMCAMSSCLLAHSIIDSRLFIITISSHIVRPPHSRNCGLKSMILAQTECTTTTGRCLGRPTGHLPSNHNVQTSMTHRSSSRERDSCLKRDYPRQRQPVWDALTTQIVSPWALHHHLPKPNLKPQIARTGRTSAPDINHRLT